jgi:glycosidase
MTQESLTSSARPSPAWFQDGVIYQIWLRSFTPEGTLKAAAARLADIADLGATVVYLSPVFLADTDERREFWSTRQKASPAKNPRNPYRAADFTRVDPEYGTEVDLRAFMAEAHRVGLRVLMDLVYHHAGPGKMWAEHPGWFLRDAQGQPLKNTWNFLRLDLQNPQLRAHLIDDMRHWLEIGADGFRCDVSGAVPLDFWVEARRALAAARPDLAMLAENQDLGAEQEEAFDASYAFGWYDRLVKVAAEGASTEVLRSEHQKQARRYPQGARFIRYSDNHDLHRASVVFGASGERAITLLHFALDGIPFIYNGQEIGDATPQDLFSHWPILWAAGALPHKNILRSWWQGLCRLRRSGALLPRQPITWLETQGRGDDDVLAFYKTAGEGGCLCAVNLRNQPVTVAYGAPDLKGRHFKSLLPDLALPVSMGEETLISLPPWGVALANWG